LTCTSAGDRKMLIWFHSPGGTACPVGGPATITRPSAGERTAWGVDVGRRSGSGKKNRKNPVRTRNGTAHGRPTSQAASTAPRSAPPMNGYPEASTAISAHCTHERGQDSYTRILAPFHTSRCGGRI